MTLPEQEISDAKYQEHEEFYRSSKLFTLALVPRDKNLIILDVGCGTGVNSEYILKLGHSVVGIDISHVAMTKYISKGHSGLQCDINKGLPFDNGSFDLVFASEVIEHLRDIRFFLLESYRVLKTQGVLLLSTPNSAFWIYRLLAVAGKTVSELQHPGHIHFFSKRSLMNYVTEAGFSRPAISARHMYILLPYRFPSSFCVLLEYLGFEREYRFATGEYFWHRSTYASRASALWADTFIVQARKNETTSEA